jgi:hypothetical protein
MDGNVSFKDYVIIACRTMRMELEHLQKTGLLDARNILYIKPGGHQVPLELEKDLIAQIKIAKEIARNIIVVYGGTFSYVNTENPRRNIDTIIQEQIEPGIKISRINASHCIDMIASEEERNKISEGKDIYWFTPGWMQYRQLVYQGWDKATANENFPRHTGGAVMLDAVGYYDTTAESDPEKLLDFADWMGIAIQPQAATLNRLLRLLSDEVRNK